MLYLLDADTLISSNQLYYPIKRFPQVWSWFHYHSEQSNVKIPIEIFDEIKVGNKDDRLRKWALNNKEIIVLDEVAKRNQVDRVLKEGYGLHLLEHCTDEELDKLGKDPFLVSYALNDIKNRCVVTLETSKPSRIGANRHIPDVCFELGITCLNVFELIESLDFYT